MAEEKKKSGGLRGMYGKKEGKEGSKKEERTEPKAEAKKEGDLEKPKEGGGMEMHEKHHAEREAMNKTHETERRDMHGNHREEHRKMASRHETAHKELAARQMEELQAPQVAQNPANAASQDQGAAQPGQAAA